MNEDFYRGYKDGLKQELKRMGLFNVFHRLVKEANENDQESVLARIKRKQQEAQIQKKMEELKDSTMGAFSEEELRQLAIDAVKRQSATGQRKILPTTNYFEQDQDDDVEDEGGEIQVPQQPTGDIPHSLKQRLSENFKQLKSDILEAKVKEIYNELAPLKNDPKNLLKTLDGELTKILSDYYKPDSLFQSFLAQVDKVEAENRSRYFLNSLQAIVESIIPSTKREYIASIINKNRENFRNKIYQYIEYLQEENMTKIMNSVFKTHSRFNPAREQTTKGGCLFKWMEKVDKVAIEISSDVTKGEITKATLKHLAYIIEEATKLINRYNAFRDIERTSEDKNRFKLKTIEDEETGKRILARNKYGQIVIGSGKYPFYPSFIEFYLRGTIKAAAQDKSTIVDRILLISDAQIPLLPKDMQTDEEIFKNMKEIARRFYDNRQKLTQHTTVSANFAGREVPKFYNRIVQAYEEGKSDNGELLEFVTMYANKIATHDEAKDADVCTIRYNIDSIQRYINKWTANYKYFMQETNAMKEAGRAQADAGMKTKGQEYTTAVAAATTDKRQNYYSSIRDKRKKKKK